MDAWSLLSLISAQIVWKMPSLIRQLQRVLLINSTVKSSGEIEDVSSANPITDLTQQKILVFSTQAYAQEPIKILDCAYNVLQISPFTGLNVSELQMLEVWQIAI